MPLYEYECPKCGTFELVRKFSDAPLESCPTCARPVEKLASAPAIQFKGTGWYITDYARKSSGGERGRDERGKDEGGKDEGGKDKGGKDKGGSKESSKEPSPSPSSESKSSTTDTKSSSSGSGDKK